MRRYEIGKRYRWGHLVLIYEGKWNIGFLKINFFWHLINIFNVAEVEVGFSCNGWSHGNEDFESQPTILAYKPSQILHSSPYYTPFPEHDGTFTTITPLMRSWLGT